MFTSRAEHRLLLRADNADERLTERAAEFGLISEARLRALREKRKVMARGHSALAAVRLPAAAWVDAGLLERAAAPTRSAAQILLSGGATLMRVEAAVAHCRASEARRHGEASLLPSTLIEPLARESIEIEVKYADYIARAERQVVLVRRNAALELPQYTFEALDSMPHLSREEVEKLRAARPRTLGEAGAIDGMTPIGLLQLLNHVRGQRRQRPRPCVATTEAAGEW